MEEKLKQAQEERRQLQVEIAGMKREAEENWAAERSENALLRERINDIAAEIARLTVTLESPSSPIEAILAADLLASSCGTATASGERGKPRKSRRAHPRAQLKASRVQPAS